MEPISQQYECHPVSRCGKTAANPPKKLPTFVWFMVLFVGRASAQDFEVSGEASCEYLGLDGATLQTVNSQFTVRKKAKTWLIHYIPDKPWPAMDVIFDGTNVYSLTRDIPLNEKFLNAYKNFLARYKFTNGVYYTSSAQISPGEYPYSADEMPRFLWFAFLSGSVLHLSPTLDIPAPWNNTSTPQSRSFKVGVKWPSDTNVFPKELSFTFSSELWSKALREQIRSQNRPQPEFTEGAVAGIYSVAVWTNVPEPSGISIPANFELIRYYSYSAAKMPKVAERRSGQVTKLHLKAGDIATDQLPQESVDVFDLRFRDVRYPLLTVSYPITNQTWIATNDSSLSHYIELAQRSYDRARKALGVGPPRTSPIKRIIVVFLCVFIALSLPIAFGLRKFSKPS